MMTNPRAALAVRTRVPLAGRGGSRPAGVALLLALSFGCASRPMRADRAEQEKPAQESGRRTLEDEPIGSGLASWYGAAFEGRLTASGERFHKDGFTAAHRTLPLGSCLRVRALENGREVRVRITDRGPYSGGRIIDLSEAAARALGFIQAGVSRVLLLRCP